MRLKVEYDTSGTFKRNMDAIAVRLGDMTPAAEFVHKTMWQGPGSTSDQFARRSGFWPNGSPERWADVQPFGNRPAPVSPLVRTGKLRAAWTGGPGGYGKAFALAPGSAEFVIAVDGALFPTASGRSIAEIHQGPQPTVIKPKTRTKSGKNWAMKFALKQKFGFWITDAKLRAGMVIPPRPLGPGPVMQQRVANLLANWIVGEGVTRQEAMVA